MQTLLASHKKERYPNNDIPEETEGRNGVPLLSFPLLLFALSLSPLSFDAPGSGSEKTREVTRSGQAGLSKILSVSAVPVLPAQRVIETDRKLFWLDILPNISTEYSAETE